ncbi:MAG: hypothetical protein LBF85_08845 [Tannerella sp.]|jgi:hypothetical protein|nr:hypothetical protein [Tannerella sp.]
MKNFHKNKKTTVDTGKKCFARTTVGELMSKLSEFSADKRIERFEIVFEASNDGYYILSFRWPDEDSKNINQ